MDPEKTAAHRQALEQAARDGRIGLNAPTATTNNPEWFVRVGGEARITAGRQAVHDKILNDWKNQVPDPGKDRIAIVTAGPPGAGKSSVLPGVQERLSSEGWRQVDPDAFKDKLLEQALEDGSFSRMVPEGMGQPGEQFFPREMAALVHHESGMISDKAMEMALQSGENVVIDGTLANEQWSNQLVDMLDKNGYSVHVVDVETSQDVAQERVNGRWQGPYEEVQEKAAQGQDVSKELGGRWVPNEVVGYMYPDGNGGRAISADNAEKLIQNHDAVKEVDRYYTPHSKAAPERMESWQRDAGGKVNHRTYDNSQTREQSTEKSKEARSVAGQSKIEQLRDKVGGRETESKAVVGGKASTQQTQTQAQSKNLPQAQRGAQQRDDKRRQDRDRGQAR
ncbi:zeta toxin family protein [Streptomyces triculaminicus]|uniref:UDP-N-acetylglucosamine kinase n=1 Tax=Streptomyces triculaminicus TaxID=2816232 RepID=A0A939JQN1_9ACTN|nr:zeta toxin family protein [Streptomyces triculaminicus]MBO0652724.1 zeta toxin family protein [Streptomyces triculaminicus]